MSETYREIITTPNPTAVTYEDYVRGIEDLFSRLADAGVYKGDRGENLKAAPINLLSQPGSTPLTYNSFTDEGKRLLNAIFDDIDPAVVFVEGGTQTEMIKKLNFFNSVNTYTWWCTDGDTDKRVFPSTAFVYIDPNAAVRDIRDYSCLLTPKLEINEDEEYELHYSKSEVFPSFWYNPLVFNGKGGWCWKINGVNTDIPASAANDTGEYNGRLFLIKNDDDTFKYYTSIDNAVNWYTFDELQAAGKRTPLDGDIGYYLVEVEEQDREGEVVKIKVINLAVFSGGNWIPASLDETDVLMKFDEVFTSYVWDCLSHKEVIADDLYIGVSTNDEKIHRISVNDNNRRQLDFTFDTFYRWEDDDEARTYVQRLDEIDDELGILEQRYAGATSDSERQIIQADINTLMTERTQIEKVFENNEEGINFTSSYKHINFGSENNVGSSTKVNIYSDAYFNREGTTTFRNNVVLDGNNYSTDNNESYVSPSLQIQGYNHINISNITPTDTQTDPISISANIGVSGQLDIRGDLKATDINSSSITCSGTLRGEKLNVQGVTAENGLLNSQKIIVANNNRTITVTPEQLTSSNVSSYLGTSSMYFLNSMGRAYLGDYQSAGSKSQDSCTMTRQNNTNYIFGNTNVPRNNSLEFTYKNCSVAAYLYYYHFRDISFNATMNWAVEVRLKNSSGYALGNWISIYHGSVNSSGSRDVSNQDWRYTYRYLLSPMSSGTLDTTSISYSGTTYYIVNRSASEGKISIAPEAAASSIGGFEIRVNINYFNSYVEDRAPFWKGVGGIGVSTIGIANSTQSGLIDSSSINISSNNLNLYNSPNSTSNPQAVLFSDGLLVGTNSRHYYIKQNTDGSVVLYATNSSGQERSTTLFNPN